MIGAVIAVDGSKRRKRAASSDPTVSISAGTLGEGFYDILLKVIKGMKSGSFTQTVLMQNGYVPDVRVR